MSGKNINFNDKKILKSTFYKNKKVNSIEDIDVNNILVSKREAYGNKNPFKYFIVYNDSDIIRPLRLRLSQITGYAKRFGDNVNISFIARDKKLLKNYIKICKKLKS